MTAMPGQRQVVTFYTFETIVHGKAGVTPKAHHDDNATPSQVQKHCLE